MAKTPTDKISPMIGLTLAREATTVNQLVVAANVTKKPMTARTFLIKEFCIIG